MTTKNVRHQIDIAAPPEVDNAQPIPRAGDTAGEGAGGDACNEGEIFKV